MADLNLLIHSAATLVMFGLIWFVQLVHYPLFNRVGRQSFPAYEIAHQARTSVLVVPLMLVEALTAVSLLFVRPGVVPLAAAVAGVVLLALVWVSTYLWQVPAHTRLSESFDVAVYRRLVLTNWVRTIGWTLRGILVCSMMHSAWM